MTKHMLIDATHTEETRVVVMNGKRIDDYDVETSARRQLKGNIYLAKVIRVEPSLQAAFVDYGENRHGFLAFSEIHPDYFQIPVADREQLLTLQEEEYAAEQRSREQDPTEGAFQSDDNSSSDEHSPEVVSGEHDTGEEHSASRRTARFLRNYRIQEVIRRRQVLLVQVVKEERGTKGAALTTYISLAGRYGVLMPNALRGGGVSRKITSDTDRKRLRDIINGLNLPRTMAMIIRTAGAGRPETEIIRDCDYLLQLWENIRSHALSSIAPTLVYEEASLIKRAIRDLFTRDIENVYVDGEAAWKNAREFTRLLMPHNANRIRLWQNRGQSLFAHYHVENHLDAMFSPTVRLESGGYIVINQTEALVAIDVNSGKSTSQRNIEETALRTNVEAAEEVARQLRLRDLAGLIVIDFIDMESRRHNNQVEKRLKEALRLDRARIQLGRISHFGLLEMSRQRLRPSIAESMLSQCPHCQGTGSIRGVESTALHVLRAIEDEATRQRASDICAHVAPGIILYMLNSKRDTLAEIEKRHGINLHFQSDDRLNGAEVHIERSGARPQRPYSAPNKATNVQKIDIIEGEAPPLPEQNHQAPSFSKHEPSQYDDTLDHNSKRKRRRRPRRRDYHETQENETPSHNIATEQPFVEIPAQKEENSTEDTSAALMPGRRRTRTRRVSTGTPSPRENPKKSPRSHAPSVSVEQPYQGPTPANPFQGFDIFDVMEQHEESQVSSPSPVQHFKEEETTASKPTRRTRRPRSAKREQDSEAPLPQDAASSSQQDHTTQPEHTDSAASPTAETEPDVKKPVRRKRRTTKTSEKDVATPAVDAEEEVIKPVRKRRTTRRKKEEVISEDTTTSENLTAPQPINIDEAKPKKRRVGWWKR